MTYLFFETYSIWVDISSRDVHWIPFYRCIFSLADNGGGRVNPAESILHGQLEPEFYHLFLHNGLIFAFFASRHRTSIDVSVNSELQHFTRYWRRGGIIVCHGHFQDVCLPSKLCFFAPHPNNGFTGCLSLCEPQTTTNLWVTEIWFWIIGAHYNGWLPYISI